MCCFLFLFSLIYPRLTPIFSSCLYANWPHVVLVACLAYFSMGLFHILISLLIFRNSLFWACSDLPRHAHTHPHSHILPVCGLWCLFSEQDLEKFYFGHFLSIFRLSLSSGFSTNRPYFISGSRLITLGFQTTGK